MRWVRGSWVGCHSSIASSTCVSALRCGASCNPLCCVVVSIGAWWLAVLCVCQASVQFPVSCRARADWEGAAGEAPCCLGEEMGVGWPHGAAPLKAALSQSSCACQPARAAGTAGPRPQLPLAEGRHREGWPSGSSASRVFAPPGLPAFSQEDVARGRCFSTRNFYECLLFLRALAVRRRPYGPGP